MHLSKDPKIEDRSRFEPMVIVISMTITFCMLWFLIIYILYQITRLASPAKIV